MPQPDARTEILRNAAHFGFPVTERERAISVRFDDEHTLRVIFDSIGRVLDVEYDAGVPRGYRTMAGPDKLNRAIAKMREAAELRDSVPPETQRFHLSPGRTRVEPSNVRLLDRAAQSALAAEGFAPEPAEPEPPFDYGRPFCGDERPHEPHHGTAIVRAIDAGAPIEGITEDSANEYLRMVGLVGSPAAYVGPCFGTTGTDREVRKLVAGLDRTLGSDDSRVAGSVALDRIGPKDEPLYQVATWDDEEGEFEHAMSLTREEARALYFLLGRELIG